MSTLPPAGYASGRRQINQNGYSRYKAVPVLITFLAEPHRSVSYTHLFLTLSRTLHSTFDPLILVHDPFVLPKEETFRFMYIKNDGELLRDYQVEIVDSIRGLVKTCLLYTSRCV